MGKFTLSKKIKTLCRAMFLLLFLGTVQAYAQTGDSTCAGLTVSINTFPASMQGKCDGAANAVVSGGMGPYSFLWNDSVTVNSRINLCSGGYYVTVTDVKGCTVFADAFVPVKNTTTDTCNRLAANISPMPVSAQGKCDGAANVTVAGGTAPFTFMWNDDATTKDRMNLCSGDYFVKVTDVKGCSVAPMVFIGVKQDTTTNPCAGFSAGIQSIPVSAQGKCDGGASVNVFGGAAPYTFMWSDSATTKDRMGLCSGGYYVKISDTKGCITNADVFIGIKPTTTDTCYGFKASIASMPVSAQGKCDGNANATTMGGTAPYSFMWADGNTLKDRMNLCAGDYYLNVKDYKGCTATAKTFIGVKQDTTTNPCAGFDAGIQPMPVSAQGKCDGGASVNVFGGTAPYMFMWNDSATTKDRMNLCSQGYYVNITDAKGCVFTADVFIGVKTTTTDSCFGLKANINPIPVSAQGVCDGNAYVTVMGGTGPYTFMWADGVTTKDRMNLCSAEYIVNVKDAKGCAVSAKVFIGVKQDSTTTNPCAGFNAGIKPMPVSAQGKCDGGAIVEVFGGAGPFMFMWNDSVNTKDRTNLCSKGYFVKVTDTKGCTVNADIFIGVKSTTGGDTCLGFRGYPVSTPVSAQGKCDGSVKIELQGGTAPYYGYWNNTNEVITSGIKLNLCSNPYTALVKDAKGCSFTIKAFVGVKYDSTATQGDPCLSLKAGIMIKPVTAQGACDGAASIMASGGTTPYKFLWSDSTLTKDRTGLCVGGYAAKIIDSKGCVFYTKAYIGVKPDTTTGNPCLNFKASVATIPVSVSGKCDGSAKVVIFGGIAPYNVVWSDLLPLRDRIGVCAGDYSVEVKDAKGCIAKAIGTVGVSATNPCANFTSVITATEKTSKCDGSAYVTVTGGTGPYMFGWSNYFTSPKAYNLCPGSYSVVVRDVNGCMTQAKTRIAYDSTVAVPTTPPLALRIKVQGASGAGTCDGYAGAYAVGGVPPYSIKFSNGVTTNENYPLCPGVYSVLVYDAQGNFDSLRFVVSSPERTFETVKTVLKDSVAIATNFANAVTECSYSFSNIDSIKIKQYSLAVAKDSVTVTWSIFMKDLSVKTVTRMYPIGQTGIYKFVLDLYCGGGATFKQASILGVSEDYAQGAETIEVQDNLVTAIVAVDQAAVLFTVYPNPVASTLNVSVDASNYSIEIKDLVGRTVMTAASYTNNYTINMENLPNGLYFVNVQAEKFQRVVKVVKQ